MPCRHRWRSRPDRRPPRQRARKPGRPRGAPTARHPRGHLRGSRAGRSLQGLPQAPGRCTARPRLPRMASEATRRNFLDGSLSLRYPPSAGWEYAAGDWPGSLLPQAHTAGSPSPRRAGILWGHPPPRPRMSPEGLRGQVPPNKQNAPCAGCAIVLHKRNGADGRKVPKLLSGLGRRLPLAAIPPSPPPPPAPPRPPRPLRGGRRACRRGERTSSGPRG